MVDLIRFEVGKRYGVSLMNEDDGRVEVTILHRTLATVWTDAGKMHRVRVWRALGADRPEREVISPLGRRFGSPVVTAMDLVMEDAG